MKTLTEEEIDHLEAEFPALSGEAFANAQQKALDAGLTVLATGDDGHLYRIHPDGRREFVEKGLPPIRVEKGSVFQLKTPS